MRQYTTYGNASVATPSGEKQQPQRTGNGNVIHDSATVYNEQSVPVPGGNPEKLLTPGSPMESLRRRHMTSNQSYHVTHGSGSRGQPPSGGVPIRSPGTNQNVAINTKVDPKSPASLVAVPIIETQIGMAKRK